MLSTQKNASGKGVFKYKTRHVSNLKHLCRDLTMDINVKGVWYGCKHAIIAMRKSGGGSIINTASFVALMGAATPQLACKFIQTLFAYASVVLTITFSRHCFQGCCFSHDVSVLYYYGCLVYTDKYRFFIIITMKQP